MNQIDGISHEFWYFAKAIRSEIATEFRIFRWSIWYFVQIPPKSELVWSRWNSADKLAVHKNQTGTNPWLLSSEFTAGSFEWDEDWNLLQGSALLHLACKELPKGFSGVTKSTLQVVEPEIIFWITCCTKIGIWMSKIVRLLDSHFSIAIWTMWEIPVVSLSLTPESTEQNIHSHHWG